MNNQKMMENLKTKQDDGSLAFLNLPPDQNSRSWNYDDTSQGKIVNTTFWVLDFMENMTTRHGGGRFLVKIRENIDDPDRFSKKFFTNSSEIKHVLTLIREHNAFPRRVTMRASGNRYYFE